MTAYVPGLEERDLKKLVISLQQLAAGRSNGAGTVTCSTGTSTTVTNANCSAGSYIQLTPSSSNAAAAFASTWISSTGGTVNGSFIVKHTAASSTDRTFNYAIIG